MQEAIIRIDELQNEIIEKSKMIDGSDEYVKQKMKLFKRSKKAEKELRNIRREEKILTKDFLSTCK
ncbi:hypothetical protein [Sulfurimonas sp.]|jgi:hypothetical protein|uniref:hypothetical protein n=1 Tax=Sulfurimonas sp. TaxID=2022749 RepID=UPI0025F50A2E|nr:hypothetical protein [Sulfurimonas sp.]MBT5934773.1 hypothetical protein [Sulfurimonas sp.]